jgi:hypothetical protein
MSTLEVLKNGKLVGSQTGETYCALMEQVIEFSEIVSQCDTRRLETFCRELANTLSIYHQYNA